MESDGFNSCSGSGGNLMEMHLSFSTSLTSGLVAQWITRLTTDQKIAGSNPAEIGIFFQSFSISYVAVTKNAPPGGLEPPTFRLTAERASRLRHGGC